MVDRGFEIEQRLVDELRHRLEDGFGQIAAQILAVRERANAQRIAVRGQYGDTLAHMLGGRAVHDRTQARLELPGPLPRSDDEGAAAEPGHARLEGRQCAQRGIEEDQPEDLAGERMRLGMALQPAGKLQQRDDLVALEIRKI